MAYVAVLAGNPAHLRETAERRWAGLTDERPDLRPAVELQRRLLGIVIDLEGAIAAGGLPTVSLRPQDIAAKLGRGVPALAAEPIPVPLTVTKPALARLCDALAEGGAADAAIHIRDAINSGNIDAGSLLAASLRRDQPAIRFGATQRGLAPDLLWLIAELAIGPFAHILQDRLLGEIENRTLAESLDAWANGYCPACGSWPAVAEAVGGHRTLRCSFCSSAWELPTYGCIYCAERGEKFVTAAPNESRKDRRLELCATCGGYLKTVDLGELSPFPLIAISDIETTDLDVAAMEHGYVRPPMKNFGGHG